MLNKIAKNKQAEKAKKYEVQKANDDRPDAKCKFV